MNKVFIVGLPRTGTTTVCVSLLALGFKVAHTAYTKQAFALADVIADTPCYCDYQHLDRQFPNSRFIYLNRSLEDWVPSMQMLLEKVISFQKKKPGKLSPVFTRCFEQTFALNDTVDPYAPEHLEKCYVVHQQAIFSYFAKRDNLLSIDVAESDSLARLINFLGMDVKEGKTFEKLNTGRMINYWDEFNHPNKVNANSAGPERRKYFDFK